jgi:hypothetical protein
MAIRWYEKQYAKWSNPEDKGSMFLRNVGTHLAETKVP